MKNILKRLFPNSRVQNVRNERLCFFYKDESLFDVGWHFGLRLGAALTFSDREESIVLGFDLGVFGFYIAITDINTLGWVSNHILKPERRSFERHFGSVNLDDVHIWCIDSSYQAGQVVMLKGQPDKRYKATTHVPAGIPFKISETAIERTVEINLSPTRLYLSLWGDSTGWGRGGFRKTFYFLPFSAIHWLDEKKFEVKNKIRNFYNAM